MRHKRRISPMVSLFITELLLSSFKVTWNSYRNWKPFSRWLDSRLWLLWSNSSTRSLPPLFPWLSFLSPFLEVWGSFRVYVFFFFFLDEIVILILIFTLNQGKVNEGLPNASVYPKLQLHAEMALHSEKIWSNFKRLAKENLTSLIKIYLIVL